MSQPPSSRLSRSETLAAVGIFAVASFFLVQTIGMPPMSALLPAAMLIGLLLLSVLMLIADQRKATAGEASTPMGKSPRRVAGAFLLVVSYALCVDFAGFYGSTAVFVPLVAFVFGYRSPLGLAIATAIVLGAIYLIFSFAMGQEFPVGRLWAEYLDA